MQLETETIKPYAKGIWIGLAYLLALYVILILANHAIAFLYPERQTFPTSIGTALVFSVMSAFVSYRSIEFRYEIHKRNYLVLSSLINLGFSLLGLFLVVKFLPNLL